MDNRCRELMETYVLHELVPEIARLFGDDLWSIDLTRKPREILIEGLKGGRLIKITITCSDRG